MTGKQIQAARVLLGWSQSALADAAGVSVPTVKRAEGAAKLSVALSTMDRLQTALESAGVVFIPENGGGAGVRLAKRELPDGQ